MTTVLALAPLASVWAQAEPEGFPDPGPALVDPDFRVNTHEFGLDRRVEMYQWRISDQGYERVWHGALIDSAGFDTAHQNPSGFPLDNERWWAPQPTLDGKPLDADVLRSLGEWRVLRPNFSRLPANLAASFQPEGDGLGSAENPLDPQIGDLRVSWRELVLPSLTGKVMLREGQWRRVEEAPEVAPTEEPASAPANPRHPERTQRLWPVFGTGLAVLIAIVVTIRRRRHRRE
ncbi:hypothetical protein GCM10027430_27460 [Lysobacter tyrosinilyticus]